MDKPERKQRLRLPLDEENDANTQHDQVVPLPAKHTRGLLHWATDDEQIMLLTNPLKSQSWHAGVFYMSMSNASSSVSLKLLDGDDRNSWEQMKRLERREQSGVCES